MSAPIFGVNLPFDIALYACMCFQYAQHVSISLYGYDSVFNTFIQQSESRGAVEAHIIQWIE